MISFLMNLFLVSWSLNSCHLHRVAYEVAASQILEFDQVVPMNDSELRSGGKIDLSKCLSIFMLVDGIHVTTS